MHACVQADGSIVGLSPHIALQSGLPFCVHAFCAVESQFTSQVCKHFSSGESCFIGSFGCSTVSGIVVCCGTFTSGSRAGCVVCTVGCVSTIGFVVTSCATGAQLIKNINASIAHFMCVGNWFAYLCVVFFEHKYSFTIFLINQCFVAYLMVQNTIAMVYDFDLTLSPHYMQDPIFRKFGVNGDDFWKEKNGWAAKLEEDKIHVQIDTLYTALLIKKCKSGQPFAGLTRADLRKLGGEITLFPGLPDFFQRTKDYVEKNPKFAKKDIRVKHYVASTGIREMLLGSAIAPYMAAIEACDFVYDENGVPEATAFVMTHAEKTGVAFRINKGCYDDPKIDVNSSMPDEKRPVPFKNMIYFGDGPSDIPCMSVIRSSKGVEKRGGYTFAVFNPKPASQKYLGQPPVNAMDLHEQKRADFVCAADYQKDSPLDQIVHSCLLRMASRIVSEIETELYGSIGAPPGH